MRGNPCEVSNSTPSTQQTALLCSLIGPECRLCRCTKSTRDSSQSFAFLKISRSLSKRPATHMVVEDCRTRSLPAFLIWGSFPYPNVTFCNEAETLLQSNLHLYYSPLPMSTAACHPHIWTAIHMMEAKDLFSGLFASHLPIHQIICYMSPPSLVLQTLVS